MSFWNRFKNLFVKAAPSAGDMALPGPAYAAAGGFGSLFGGSQRNWQQEAGDVTTNSAVSILLNFVCQNFCDARFGVKRQETDGSFVFDVTHDVARLVKRPNPFWTRTQLLSAILISRYLNGNAYVLKVRSRAGKVVELWWLPHDLVEPQIDKATGRITGYKYKVGSTTEIYAPDDVIHIKTGVNLSNPVKGQSPLYALLREVCTDNEVQTYTYSILKNMGTPGAIISPKDADDDLDEDFRTKIKQLWREKTTGDNRGDPLVLNAPLDIQNPAFEPNKMMIDKTSELSEARLAGAFGVPTIVVQFVVGLRNSNAKASYEESIQQAYGCCLIPLQRELCEWFDLQLLPELGDEMREYCAFDNSEISALQESQDALHKRADDGFKAGTVKRSEARAMKGLQSEADDEIYFTDLVMGAGLGALPAGEPDPTVDPGADPTADTKAVPDAAALSLNGAQITAALGVVGQFRDGLLSEFAAIELLVAVGVPRDRAQEMVASIEVVPLSSGQSDESAAKTLRFQIADYWRHKHASAVQHNAVQQQ